MTKKEQKPEQLDISYSIDENTTTGTWAPASEQFTVSYDTAGLTPSGAGTLDSLDIGEMMRQDAGKGMENMKFEDWNDPKPFENSVPSLEQIDKVCKEYPSLKIAYEKFKNVWRICYEDYRANNKDEGVW